MEYTKPTYEEYCEASAFAKVRYRYGIYVQLVAVILLLFLIYYAVTNIEEMKANPKDYAEEKLGVICSFPIYNIDDYNYGSYGNITSTREG